MYIFGTNADFNKNEAKNILLGNEIAFPSLVAGDAGYVFYHSGLTAYYGWTGTVWVLLSATLPKPLYIEDLTVTTSHDIDWDYDTFRLTLTGNTTFSESNLPVSGTNTKVITIYMDGNFTPTYPANWTNNLSGSYDGTVLNQIVVEFIKTGVYWMTINQVV